MSIAPVYCAPPVRASAPEIDEVDNPRPSPLLGARPHDLCDFYDLCDLIGAPRFAPLTLTIRP